MKRCCFPRNWLPIIALWIATTAFAPAWSADTPAARPAGPDVVTLNFVNADIDSVVKAVSEITGKNFVIDPRVKGTVNIVSARPMSRALVYDVFLSALRLQGFAAIDERGIIKIVPESDAKLQSSPTFGPLDKSRNNGDQIQTRVFALKYESAAQLVQVLRPLIAPNNTINANQNNNTLVITDYASNLQRIEKIIDSIDQPSGTDPIMIPLNYASALDVAQAVNKLFAESAQGGGDNNNNQRILITADTRSNSLLARSDNPSRLARLRSLVAMLDTPTSAIGNIHVVYLKNAEAVQVAAILRAVFEGNVAPGSHSDNKAFSASVTSKTSAAPQGMTPTSPSFAAAATASASETGDKPGFIQADAATNSIIITAPDAIYNNLRAALDKLDVRRAQVYVEALIAEVSAEKTAEFGVQFQNYGNGSSSAQAVGGTNFGTIAGGQNIIGISAAPATAGTGLNLGVAKGTITLPGIGQIVNLSVLVRALESDTNTNILSTPNLLTLDNEEATIVVGQNVPFITGSYAVTGAATTPTPFQTIERQDVGLTLKIKPQISEGGVIRLQIYQEVSSVVNTVLNNPAGPTTNKRSIESTVLVDDGQIVVLGGLIQDAVTDGVEKVPLLGDIPWLGSLFQYQTRKHAKTNLMVFLRPVILRTADSAETLTSKRYEQIIDAQHSWQPARKLVLPDVKAPTLPAFRSLDKPEVSTPAEASNPAKAP